MATHAPSALETLPRFLAFEQKRQLMAFSLVCGLKNTLLVLCVSSFNIFNHYLFTLRSQTVGGYRDINTDVTSMTLHSACKACPSKRVRTDAHTLSWGLARAESVKVAHSSEYNTDLEH